MSRVQKYKYALNRQTNEIIDVETLDKVSEESFVCPECNDEMIAKLGKVRIKHFAHKSGCDCCFETYIHKLAKLYYANLISKRMKSGKPIYLVYSKPCHCRKDRSIFEGSTEGKINILEYFNRVEVEASVGKFKADIALYPRSITGVPKSPLLLEIAVTHKCSEEKRGYGLPIFEIQISKDEPLDDIFWMIDDELVGSMYNDFTTAAFCECQTYCSTNETTRMMYSRRFAPENQLPPYENYRSWVLHSHFYKDVPQKSCHLCKFCRKPEFGSNTKYDVFCISRRCIIHSRKGVEGCGEFLFDNRTKFEVY